MRRDRYTDGKTRKGCGQKPRGKVTLFIKKKKKVSFLGELQNNRTGHRSRDREAQRTNAVFRWVSYTFKHCRTRGF